MKYFFPGNTSAERNPIGLQWYRDSSITCREQNFPRPESRKYLFGRYFLFLFTENIKQCSHYNKGFSKNVEDAFINVCDIFLFHCPIIFKVHPEGTQNC